jgi:hypothetical protein
MIGSNVCVVRNAMIVARKSSEKINAEMFNDIPVRQRKWKAALRPGERLPCYGDVMLGSLGRLADHIILLKENNKALVATRYRASCSARRSPLPRSKRCCPGLAGAPRKPREAEAFSSEVDAGSREENARESRASVLI